MTAMQPRSHLVPILVAALGVAFLSWMDAFLKGAALAMGAFTAAWLRAAIGTAIAAPVWLATGGTWPQRAVLALHIQRGVVSAFMVLTFAFALTKLAIAEAIAISFIAPLIALYLAHWLLGETIRRTALLSSLLGFAGTLIIVAGKLARSDFDADAAWGLAAILVSALLYAYNFILMRRQSQRAGPGEIATFHSGVTFVVLGVATPLFFVMPDARGWLLAGASAVLTVCGAALLAWAYARAETQTLIPLEYSGFAWAVVLGWAVFGEVVTPTTVLGTMTIIAACLLAARAPRAVATPA